MSESAAKPLTASQLAALQSSLHRGSAAASAALASWIGRPSLVEIDSLNQIPLAEATTVLSKGEEPICFCAMDVQGVISGQIILAFDDASGLALAGMLLDQTEGPCTEWSELASSAVVETANIVCCSYLNSLSSDLSVADDTPALVPAPPRFSREFAESLMQFALMDQAIAFDQVILAQTRFMIDGEHVDWTLLFVPDAESMTRLPEMLADPQEGV